MKEFLELLKSKNIIRVTPVNQDILYPGVQRQIFKNLESVAKKYKKESFGMMPRMGNIRLISGEVVEAVVNANFRKGKFELIDIYLYDYTKIKYDEVKALVQQHYKIHLLN